MKILVVCQLYYPENFIIYKIAEQFVKDGHEVDVLTGKPNYGYGYILPEYKKINEEIINGVNVHRVNIKAKKKSRISTIFNYLSFWNKSKSWVRKTKNSYDVVYSMSLSPVTICSAGNLYKKLHKVPHVIHCVDLWPESVVVTKAVKKNSLTYKILYIWSHKIYSKADRILVGSPSFTRYFADVLKLPVENISYVPQCSLVENIDVEAYQYGKGTHILYCGNLGLIQLIPLMLEGFEKVLKKNKDIYLHVIGMGPMSEYLIDYISKRGLENNIIYHGPMNAEKAAPYFKGADALYVSLLDEGAIGKTIPNKLMMSMAFQKPIIAVLNGDGREVLNQSKGALFAEQDADSLAKTFDDFYQLSEKERTLMGASNRQYYEKYFSLRSISKQIEEKLK